MAHIARPAVAAVALLTLLAGCGTTAAPGTAPTRAAAQLAAQASAGARDKICQTYLDEYARLSWDYEYQAKRKQMLLDLIGSTGSGVALAPLTQEYEKLSWDYEYQAKRKQVLMDVVTKLLQGSSVPCSTTTITPAQRDQVCQTYLKEYQGLSWDYEYQAKRKDLLLEMVAATGSDLGITAFSDEYAKLSWDYEYQATRKQKMLGAISKALAVPTQPCDTRQAMAKPSKARAELKAALKAELATAPKAMREALKAAIAKIPG